MRRLAISDAALLRRILRDAAEADPWMRLMHRLHCLILVDAGRSCREVGRCFNEAPRTIQRWIHAYERKGIEGLRDRPRPGRPRRLDATQAETLARALRQAPSALGYPGARWTGRALAMHLDRACGLSLSARHCQRLLRAARDTSSDVRTATGSGSATTVRPRRQ